MSSRRAVPAILASAFALLFFGLGNYLGARQTADSDEQLAAHAVGDRSAQAARGRARRHRRPVDRSRRPVDATDTSARVDRRRRQAAAAGRDGPAAAQPAARAPQQLRRAVLPTTTTGRAATARPGISARATSSPSSTASSRSARRACRTRGRITSVKLTYKGQLLDRARRRCRRRARRSRPGRLGDPEGQGAGRPAAAQRQPRPTGSSSPIRSSASATTTRRASSCRPATSASGRPTTW